MIDLSVHKMTIVKALATIKHIKANMEKMDHCNNKLFNQSPGASRMAQVVVNTKENETAGIMMFLTIVKRENGIDTSKTCPNTPKKAGVCK